MLEPMFEHRYEPLQNGLVQQCSFHAFQLDLTVVMHMIWTMILTIVISMLDTMFKRKYGPM